MCELEPPFYGFHRSTVKEERDDTSTPILSTPRVVGR